MDLTELTWPAVAELSKRDTPVVIPLAALEQHGHHLPLFTDSMLTAEIVRRVAETLGERVLFAPLQWLGNSDHHLDFAGTLSAAPRCYLDLLNSLAENFLHHGFRRLIFLNGHGGNDVPGKQAVFELRQRHRQRNDLLLLFATYWNAGAGTAGADSGCTQTEMGHACEWETSMILRIAPHLVGDYVSAPDVDPGRPFLPASRGWVTQDRSGRGHIGSPRLATAEKGEKLFQCFARDVTSLLERVLAWNGKDWERMSSAVSRKWWICGLLLMASAINYMDRQTLVGASVRITREMGLNQEQYGSFEAGFGWAFAAGSVLFGVLADRLPLRWLYAIVVALWSAAGIATGFAKDYHSLLWCRIFLGFFEAGHWPCGVKATRALLDARDRSLGNGLLQSGTSIGAVITPLILAAMMTKEPGSWRWAFQVVGASGILWLALWLWIVKPSDFSPVSTGGESSVREQPATPWYRVIFTRRMAVVLAVIALINTTWQILRAWLPKFLQEGRGYSESHALYFNSVWFAVTDIGCLGAGALAFWLCRRGMSVTNSRLLVFGGCAALSAVTLALPFLQAGWLLLAVLLIAGAGALGVFPVYHAISQDLSGPHQGKVTGVAGIAAWGLSPLHILLGRWKDRTGSYDVGLAIVGVLPLIALVFLVLFWKPPPTPIPEPSSQH